MESYCDMGNVMKMIADWCYGDKPEGTRDYEDIPKEERDWNPWWYLHGKLEEYVHYDKATVTNCLSGGFAKETVNWSGISGGTVTEVTDRKPMHMMCVDGVVDVEIEGIDKPCVGYFWTIDHKKVCWKGEPYDIWEQRGFVCFADDAEACEYAARKMSEKSRFL